MKAVFKVLLAIVLLLVTSGVFGYFYMQRKFKPSANQLTVTGLPTTATFVWWADSSAQPVIPHAALLVPVSIPGCSRTCYLQFDTGAPSSMLYAKSLAALRAAYPATSQSLLPQADTIRNFHFSLGSSQGQARWMRVLEYGTSQLPANTTAPFVIGTLGTDILEDNVLVLDYAQRQFQLTTRLPDSLDHKAVFVPLSFASRRVIFNAGIQDETEQLLFDSGSSAFSLITSETIWQKLAKPSAAVRIAKVNAVNRILTTYTVPTAAMLQMATTTLPLQTVTHVEGTNLMENLLMRFSGMGGMLGNQVFDNQTIILDAPGGRFGVVKP